MNTLKVGINGFGRIGRLALRAAFDWPDMAFIAINDPGANAESLAHLLNFDSVHGRWQHEAVADGDHLCIGSHRIRVTANKTIEATDWSDCDVVIEASGVMKTVEVLNGYLVQGVGRVVVTAPVKEAGALNIVMGVNDHLFDPATHRIVTAASCTTNCLAPVVKVIHENLGIRHGSITTIHSLTNTQTILDAPHKDPRRARACGSSLIPTSTGSATAIIEIFPELKGRLDGHAVRVPTNLVGGYLGAHMGLNRTMNIGLFLQIVALVMLAVPTAMLSVPLVMGAQALSGIAKDLNKMSAKSGIKLLVPGSEQGKLYRWVALLTGSKNTLKGVGFFLGGALLMIAGFQGAVLLMAAALLLVWLASLVLLTQELGKSSTKPKFTDILSKNRAINILSLARMFLFGARDVWFVVALPVYLHTVFDWDFWQVGGFMASWVIGYGAVQAIAPRFTHRNKNAMPGRKVAVVWAALLTGIPAAIAIGLDTSLPSMAIVVGGLMLFGVVFAFNSSLHSYLIVSLARADGVSLDVGFYYMSNAMGRLIGTLLSGWVYQVFGLAACLWVSTVFLLIATIAVARLPENPKIPSNDIASSDSSLPGEVSR